MTDQTERGAPAPTGAAPFFRGHAVRGIQVEDDGLVLFVKRDRESSMTRFTYASACAFRDLLPDSALRSELDDALAVCEHWQRTHKPARRRG